MIDEATIRRALIGFCGANRNALLHYLTYTAKVESEAAGSEMPDDDELTALRTAIMEWLDDAK